MNSYFSRLAQRSGLASTAANVRHGSSSGNAAPDWSEQSVETATPLNTLTSNGESGTPAGAIDNKSIHGSEHSPPSASSQVTNTRSKSMITQQHEQKFDAVNATLNSSLLSNTLGTSSNFIEPDSSQDSLNAETSVTLSTPNERGSKRESFSASAKHASVTFDHPLAIEWHGRAHFLHSRIGHHAFVGGVAGGLVGIFEPAKHDRLVVFGLDRAVEVGDLAAGHVVAPILDHPAGAIVEDHARRGLGMAEIVVLSRCRNRADEAFDIGHGIAPLWSIF